MKALEWLDIFTLENWCALGDMIEAYKIKVGDDKVADFLEFDNIVIKMNRFNNDTGKCTSSNRVIDKCNWLPFHVISRNLINSSKKLIRPILTKQNVVFIEKSTSAKNRNSDNNSRENSSRCKMQSLWSPL